MNLNDIITEAEKVRLDPKCWTGKKIGNPKTKVKGGVRVNNCVPAESVNEMDSQGYKGSRDDDELGKGKEHTGRPITAKKATTDAERIMNRAHSKMMKSMSDDDKVKKGWRNPNVKEGGPGSGRVDPLAWDTTSGKVGRVEKTATGIRHHADPSRYGGTEPSTEINKLDKTTTSATDKALGVKWDRESKRYYSPIKVDEQGYNAEYDDEAGMADNNLKTLARAVEGIDDVISAGDNLPEWCQEKIAVAKSMLVAVWDYMKSEENTEQGVAEGRKLYSQEGSLEKWTKDAEAAGHKVVHHKGKTDPNSTHHAINKDGKVVGKFFNATYVNNKRGHLHTEGVAEGLGLYGPFTVTINTGERPQSRTKTKKFRREDDAILWAQDWLEDAPQYVFATAEVTDPEGNVVWTTDEQGVSEGEMPKTWHDVDPKLGKQVDKMSQAEKVKKGLAHPDTLKKKEQRVSEGICSIQEANAIFDDFERSVEARGLTEDIFDTITDEEIIAETAAWRRKEGKSKKGGLNAKGVASYRRENPGSKLQMAVTTKPSKLKPGSKAAKRRKSFCARMSGVKGPMKKPNGKPTRKALALRKWNC